MIKKQSPQSTCRHGQYLTVVYRSRGGAAPTETCRHASREDLLDQPLEKVSQALTVRHHQTMMQVNNQPMFCSAERCQ